MPANLSIVFVVYRWAGSHLSSINQLLHTQNIYCHSVSSFFIQVPYTISLNQRPASATSIVNPFIRPFDNTSSYAASAPLAPLMCTSCFGTLPLDWQNLLIFAVIFPSKHLRSARTLFTTPFLYLKFSLSAVCNILRPQLLQLSISQPVQLAQVCCLFSQAFASALPAPCAPASYLLTDHYPGPFRFRDQAKLHVIRRSSG